MSNFLADNIGWLAPLAIILLTSLFGKRKKDQSNSAPRVANTPAYPQQPSRPMTLPEFLRQMQQAQQQPAQRTMPQQRATATVAPAVPEEGVRAVADEPITNRTAMAATTARPAVSHQTLRRAIIWSQILQRPQF